jgi:hypothetical protein
MTPDSKSFRPADPLGIQRVLSPKGALPQQAESLDAGLPLAQDELLIEVESLNIDSASFHQISEVCQGDLARIEKHILELVARRGKHHNPVTGSGGMLIGRVAQVGPDFPVKDKPVAVGDRIATLVSLSLTPLSIRKIRKIHPKIDRVDIEGHAVLFAADFVEFAAHETLHREDRVCGIRNGLAFGGLADEAFAGFCEGYDGWCGACALGVFQHDGLTGFHHRHARVCGS